MNIEFVIPLILMKIAMT